MFPSQDCQTLPLREVGDFALGVSRKELVVVSTDGQPILRADCHLAGEEGGRGGSRRWKVRGEATVSDDVGVTRGAEGQVIETVRGRPRAQ